MKLRHWLTLSVVASFIVAGLLSLPFVGADKIKLGLPIGATKEVSVRHGLEEYLAAVYIWATEIAGTIAILMVIYGGYRYITSQGDQAAVTEAKEIIIGAITGLLLLLLAYIILKAISPGIVAF